MFGGGQFVPQPDHFVVIEIGATGPRIDAYQGGLQLALRSTLPRAGLGPRGSGCRQCLGVPRTWGYVDGN